MKIRTRRELEDYVNKGNKVKYLFFWGHTHTGQAVTKACFSQWYGAPFSEDGKEFATAEHYMMYGKAKLFDDALAMANILKANNPGAAKAEGRKVRNFNQERWNENKFDLVVNANLAKFKGNAELKEFLLKTGERVLVEASPVDRVWGVGLSEDSEAVSNPNRWKGENLLGFALMEVRERLSK